MREIKEPRLSDKLDRGSFVIEKINNGFKLILKSQINSLSFLCQFCIK